MPNGAFLSRVAYWKRVDSGPSVRAAVGQPDRGRLFVADGFGSGDKQSKAFYIKVIDWFLFQALFLISIYILRM